MVPDAGDTVTALAELSIFLTFKICPATGVGSVTVIEPLVASHRTVKSDAVTLADAVILRMLGETLVVAGSLAADRVPDVMLVAFVVSVVADAANAAPAVFVTVNTPADDNTPSPDTVRGAYEVDD
jgi:hypothetical protein